MERKVGNQLTSATLLKPDNARKPRSSFLVPQIPNIDEVNKRIGNLESFVETIKSNLKIVEKDLKYEVNNLKANKAEKIPVGDNAAEIKNLKKQLLEVDKLCKDSILSRISDIQKNHIPHFYKKMIIHDEAIDLNAN